MKKGLSLLLAFLMLITLVPVTSFAETEISVYISVAENGSFVNDKNGEPIVYREVVITKDSPTINDAFVKLHDEFYQGGAQVGYETTAGTWGDMITKFMGKSAAYSGYYNNHSYALGITDSITDGAYLCFWFYQDTTNWSDKYSRFDQLTVSAQCEEDVRIKLTDGTSPIPNANITINGEAVQGLITDEEGNANICFTDEGRYTISATSEELFLVPPVCIADITGWQENAANIVAADREALNIDSIADKNIDLPLLGASNKTQITWASSDESVINTKGEISRGETNREVTLTATLTYGDCSSEKSFNVTVLAKVIPIEDTVLSNIAKTYATESADWKLMDMAAYEDLYTESEYKTKDNAKQNYINTIISKLKKSDLENDEAGLAKAIITLTAIGVDSTSLYPANSNNSLNAVEKLLNIKENSSSAWIAPYVTLALSQGDYDAEEKINSIINAVIENQKDDGSWNEWDDSIQTTSNIIAGLALYYNKNESVKSALDKAIEYLSTVQKDDGTFDAYGRGSDTNTNAMVVIALASVGINPDTDPRFIKNETSVYDALFNYLTEDLSGFGYQDTSYNDYSTEQAFRAVIAAKNVMDNNQAYNIYDFSHVELEPGRATGNGTVSSPGVPDTDDTITVKFTLKSKNSYWIKNKSITLEKGSKMYHAFVKACDDYDIEYVGAEDGYVEEISNGKEVLKEFGDGPDSGWLYKVNGEIPNKGILEYELSDGDNITWFYTTDWKKVSGGISGGTGGGADNKSDQDEKEDKSEEVVEEEIKDDTKKDPSINLTDTKNHWAKDYIDFVTSKGYMNGTGNNRFSPDYNLSRGMLVTILYRIMGEPEVSGESAFDDIKEDWYKNAVIWAKEMDIAKGYNVNTFGIDDMITRQQLATMLFRLANNNKSTDIDNFTDANLIDQWALEAVKWAVANKIINGNNDGTLNPHGYATRAEAAAVIYRLSEII